jgi:hypothetical protein
MPIYRISAPDGNTYSIEGPEGASQQDVIQKVLAQYPESGTPRQPRKGLLADVAGGAENLLNISKTGIAALMGDSNAAAQAGLERQKNLQQKYESGFQPEKILAEYDKGNYLSAAGEALSQVPSAVASLLPSAGQAATSAVAGRIGGGALGSVFGPAGTAVGATVGQYAVPFVVNAIQALGSQAQEKAKEQLDKGEQVDVDVAELAPYASANAALNLVGTRIAMPSVFKKAIGQKVAAEADDVARLALLEKATKVAGRGNIETVARGTLGFAAGELPTEILQDVVDRAAVGKPLTDEDAMQSYRITALNMVLGAPLGGPMGLQERSGARTQVGLQEQRDRQAKAVADAQARTEAAAARQARLQSPEYAKEAEQAYQAALKVQTDLQAQLQKKAKGQKLTDEQKQANVAINAQLKEQAPTLKAARAEYDRVSPILNAIKEQERVDAMSPEDYMLDQMQKQAGQGIQRSKRTGAERTLYTPPAPPTPAPAVVPAEDTTLPDYAAQQISAARNNARAMGDAILDTDKDMGRYVDYLMQDPQLAQQLVTKQIALPAIQEGSGQRLSTFAFTPEQNSTILLSLKLQLEAQAKQAKKAATEQAKQAKKAAAAQEKQAKAAAAEQEKQAKAAAAVAPAAQTVVPETTLDTLDSMREQGASEAEVAEQAAELEKQYTPYSEQGTIFLSANNDIRTAEVRAKSRPELIADLQIARATGNRKAVEIAVEQLRRIKEAGYGLTQPEVRALLAEGKTKEEVDAIAKQKAEAAAPNRELEQATGITQTVKSATQQDASDARAAAYGEMVSILNRFNMGMAKRAELEAARDKVLDNLVLDINTTRATPMDDSQERQVRNDAGTYLRDLITRFGDTRNLVQTGTGKQPQFYPAQKATGEFTQQGQPGITVESRAPGRQTFANPFAAVESIQEGLNVLRRNAIGETATNFEPLGAYKANVNRMLAQLPENLPPEKKVLADAIDSNKAALLSNQVRAQDIAEWLYKTRVGSDTKELDAVVNAHLADLEQGKRSETETTRTGEIKRAVQEDLFPDEELQGKQFATAAEFEDYLASDTLHSIRQEIGPVAPTMARLQKQLQPLQRRADSLASAIETLRSKHEALQAQQKVFAEETKAEAAQRLAQAEELYANATNRMAVLQRQLDMEFVPFQIEYLSTQEKLKEAVDYSKDLSDTIAQNLEKFQGAKTEVKTAMDAVIAAKQTVVDAAGKDVSKSNWDGMRTAQQNVVKTSAKLASLRAQLPDALNAFLKRDRFFQAKLAAELKTIAELDANFKKAKTALARAAAGQERRKVVKQAKAEIVETRTGIRTTREKNEADARAAFEIQKDFVAQEKALGQRAVRAEGLKTKTEERIAAAKKPLEQLAQRRAAPAQTAAKESFADAMNRAETLSDKLAVIAAAKPNAANQTEREEIDAAVRKLNNERPDRLNEILGETVSFEAYRTALADIDDIGPRLEELTAKAADETLPKTTRDKANREIKKLGMARKFLEASGEGQTELRLQAEVELAKLQKKILHQEELVAENPTKARKQELAKSKRAAKAQQQILKQFAVRGERTPIATRSDKATQAAEAMANEFLERSAAIAQEGTMGKLENRKRGPSVKKGTQPGNIRTGVATTEKERLLASRNPIEQSGKRQESMPLSDKKLVLEANKVAKERVENLEPLTEEEVAVLAENQKIDLLEAAILMRKNLERSLVDVTARIEFAKNSPNPRFKNVDYMKDLAEEKGGIERNLLAAKENETTLQNQFAEDLGEADETGAPVEGEKPLKVSKAAAERAAAMEDTSIDDEFAKLMDEDVEEELNLTVPHDDVKFAVRDNDIMGVVDGLIKHGSTPAVRKRAKELREFLHGTTIGVDRFVRYEGKMVSGLYQEGRNKITMHPNRVTEEDLLHELTHAATTKAMRTPDAKLTPMQRKAKQGIISLFKAAEGRMDLEGQYGIKDVHEFMAEVNSSKDFRNRLDGIGKPESLWQKLQRFIAELFNQTPSTEALALIKKIYMPSETYFAKKGEKTAFAKEAKYGEDNALTQLARDAVFDGSNSTEKVMDNAALRFEMNYVDMRAALRKVLDIGAKAFGDSRLFQQAMFSYTDADQKMSLTYAAMNEGYLKLSTDSKGFKFIESSGKESVKDVFVDTGNIPDKYGDEAGKVGLATAYMAAQRAANKGLSKLDLDALGLTEEKMAAALAAADADPELKNALEKVRETYNAYNEGMIRMVQDSGAISKAFASELLKDKDYVPYYRVRPDGTAVLVLGNDRTITVGDIKHQPWLRELKGGETKILPITQSIPRNTMLLVSMATSNMARRNFAYAMQEIGRGQGEVDPRTGEARNLMPILSGKGPDDPSIIRFKQEPDPNKKDDKGDRYIRIQTKGTVAEGVPAELVIKSMEGAPLTLPAFLKWGGIAGDVLRKGVTRMPMYLIRQLFRDPMAAAATSGLDYGMFTAVYKANKEFLRMTFAESKTAATMLKKGLIQSGVFTGDPDDVETMALQLVSGKDFNTINKVCREADKLAMNADAATRSLVYENAIKNGMSEAEAKFAVQESMNFHKRGLSAGTQYLSRLIPFFNAQIQGLNVLYKAGSGQMPFEQQLQIKQKFYNNALFLVAGGLAYAMAMQDDEYYKNAKPKDRYSNFFLHTPFTDEPLKLPIPYEFGWFFSMGAAAADAVAGQADGTQQLKALQSMLVGAIPGSSSMGVPQILKPFAEVWANKDFNTGFALESTRLRGKSTEERYNANTTELAKAMSQFAPVLSPIQIERIVGGYLGPLPILVAAATNGLFKDGDVEPVPKNMSEMPFIGSGFQKKYGGADSDVMYRLADEALQAKRDFDSMKREGRIADAQEYVQDHRIELRVAPLALQYQKLMGNFRTMEERIRGSTMPGDEKRKRIDDIQKRRQELAEKFENRIKELAT